MVITHPETTIRGHKFSEHGGIKGPDTDGYFISGIVIQTSLLWEHQITRHFSIYVEPKITAAYATIPVYGESADVPNLAVHLDAGLYFSF